jgi:hypothetical protein
MKCQCNTSTGICGSITRGTGCLDFNGYWEFPCTHSADNKKAQGDAELEGRAARMQCTREQSLYSPQHQLNRTEAWERLDYWINRANCDKEYNLSVIRILVDILRKDEEENAEKPEDAEAKRILEAEKFDFYQEEGYSPENWDDWDHEC